MAEGRIRTIEIEIGMLADIGDGGFVGHRFVNDRQHPTIEDCIGGRNRAVAGVTSAAIGVDDLQEHVAFAMFHQHPVALPHAVAAAMQVAYAFFVQFQLIVVAID